MRDIIIILQKSDTYKIQLTIAINFISSKDVDKERVMHSKSNDIEFIPYDNANDVVKELFETLLSRYQIGLETSMRGSNCIFDSVQLLYDKCHNINSKRGGSYIGSPNWIKKKRTTINPTNKDDKFLQYAATVALNNEKIKRDPQRISKIKPFINKCNWNGIKYPSKIDNWKTFEKINLITALNILYIKQKEIYPVYISKHSSTREKQIILVIISNKEKEGWHYLAVKKLSPLLHGITSKYKGDFYRLNCLHSFRTESLRTLKSHKKVCKNKYFC